MTMEISGLVVGLIAALLGSGGLTTFLVNRRIRNMEAHAALQDANISQQAANENSMLSFYAMWNEELKRLRKEIDMLHLLVASLEQEIVALGGDPVRVRLELARKNGKG